MKVINTGMEAQLNYLLDECGMKPQDIVEQASKEE